jgi:hypothetical protein
VTISPHLILHLTIISPEGSGWGMNVAFSSSTDFNPSDWISGLWYNSEIGNFPGYDQPNLDTSG